jgi:putative inorganic carbon (hco3(-)) transporter
MGQVRTVDLMHPLWQKLTLTDVSLPQWQQHSYATRWVGAVQGWRGSSWILQWGESIGALIAVAILGMSPFVSTNFLSFFLIISAVFWLLLTIADDGPQGFTPIHLTVLAFLAIAIIASAFAPEKALGLKGLRLLAFSDGISKLLLYVLFFAMFARLLRSARLRSWILGIYLHIALFVSIFGVHQAIYGAKALATWVDPESPLAKTTRAYSYLGNPNLLAAYLLPAIALSISAAFIWPGRGPKALAIFMVVINNWCLYATLSRGGWIAAIALLVVMGIGVYYWYQPQLSSFWQRWMLPIALGAAIVLVGGAIVVSPTVRERFASMFTSRGDSSNNVRINVWLATLDMIKNSPWLGIGYGDRVFKKVYPIYQVNPKFSALSAYSIYLETIVEIGFVGLISFLWIMLVAWCQGVLPLHRLRQSGDTHYFWLLGGLGGSFGLAVMGFFDTVWYRPVINILWWLTIALIASFYYPAISLRPHQEKS